MSSGSARPGSGDVVVDSSTRAPLTSSTKVVALLGDPVRHSRSPLFQNAGFLEAGVDGVYVSFRCRSDDLRSLMRTLALSGGGGNVTLPHKEQAATMVDVPTEAVRRTGACNTFWGEGDAVHGDNTDVEGFRRALERFLREEARPGPAGARVLLLGAGGASRAVLAALLDDAVGTITILNRRTDRARAVAREVGDARVHVVEGAEKLKTERFDLVVNATRLGLAPGDPLPLDLGRIGGAAALFDLVYGDAPTPFVLSARSRGIPAVDGAEMLVQQGAAAFERWWGLPAPVEVMRAALGGTR